MIYDVAINIPKHVNELLNMLNKYNYESFVIGGCVRDSLLNLSPHDWDITTNATPDEMIQLFKKEHLEVLPVGLKFGTVVVVYKGNNYEITTYRSDGIYEDGRRPNSVTFETTLEADVLRRDLTINALAYNPSIGLVDYVGGYEDLQHGELRFVGNIVDRLNEDSLRALRAVRFLCKFNFRYSREDLDILCNHFQNNYNRISMERITQEIIKLFEYKNISIDNLDIFVRLLSETVIPEIKPMINCTQINVHHIYDVYYHTINVMYNCMECGDPRLMFAALFHDIGKPIVKKTSEDGTEHFTGHPDESAKIAREVLLRLKVSTSFVEDVVYLVKIHDSFNQGFKIRNIRRFVAKTPKKQLERWLKLRSSDVASQAYFVAKTQNLKDVCDAVNQVLEDGTAITLSDLKINGNDILALGINDKRNIKHILNELLSNCYGSPSLNNRDWLMKYAAKLVKRCNNNPKWAEEHWLSKDNKK